jgi:hypothetical protein
MSHIVHTHTHILTHSLTLSHTHTDRDEHITSNPLVMDATEFMTRLVEGLREDQRYGSRLRVREEIRSRSASPSRDYSSPPALDNASSHVAVSGGGGGGILGALLARSQESDTSSTLGWGVGREPELSNAAFHHAHQDQDHHAHQDQDHHAHMRGSLNLDWQRSSSSSSSRYGQVLRSSFPGMSVT